MTSHLTVWRKYKRVCGFACVYRDAQISVFYLPVTSRQVLERPGSALQGGRVRALSQQRQVRLDHRRVPEHLCPFGRLGEARDWSHTVPLNHQTNKQCLVRLKVSWDSYVK